MVSLLRVVQLSDLYLQTFDRRWAKVVEEVERFNLDPEIAVFDFLLKRQTF